MIIREREIKKVELLRAAGDSRKLYQDMKPQRTDYAPATTLFNDASGNVFLQMPKEWSLSMISLHTRKDAKEV